MTEDSYEEHFEAEPDNDDSEPEDVEEHTVEDTEPEQEETQEPETEAETTESDGDEDSEELDKPVSEGEEVEVEIEDLGSKGDGIARKEGFVIFVPGGEVGETYEVEVTSVGRKFAFGEIL